MQTASLDVIMFHNLRVDVLVHAVPVASVAGHTYVWDFDFTHALGPNPVLTEVRTSTQISAFSIPSPVGVWAMWSELGGGLTVGSFTGDLGLALDQFQNSFDVAFLDGTFSLTLTLTSGDLTAEPLAFAYRNGLQVASIAPQPLAVPEPPSALLGMMALFAAASASVRRPRRGQQT